MTKAKPDLTDSVFSIAQLQPRDAHHASHANHANQRGFFLQHRRVRWMVALAVLLAAMWIGGLMTFDGTPRGPAAIMRILLHLPGPLAWMLGAFGLGVAAVKILQMSGVHWTVALALGCVGMLLLDVAAATLGFFSIEPIEIPATLLVLPGIFALWRNFDPRWTIAGRWGRGEISNSPDQLPDAAAPSNPFMAWTIAPAVAVLLLAAASAPGWLWSTEFGGYDALSYHLQLPREWLALGSVQTLPHNIYSTFPSFMECAYLHVMAMRGSAQDGALDAQVLHALFALAAAMMVANLAQVAYERMNARAGARELPPSLRSAVGWCAAALLLGLPWIIVTGSLAYDEMPVVMLLAAALWLLVRSADGLTRGVCVALAILCAGAMGCKLTAALFVTAPVGVLTLIAFARDLRMRRATIRGTILTAALMLCAGFLLLSPWWVRGALANGSPFFPILGDGGLTAIQAKTFHNAHGPLAVDQWWSALRDQYLCAGLTAAHTSLDPWRPFWSILPWLGGCAGLILLCRRHARATAVMMIIVVAVQLFMWLYFTHSKGRFLIPTAVPLVVLCSLVMVHLYRAGMFGRIALSLLLFGWCLQPLWAYATDGPLIEAQSSPATGIGLEPLFMGESGGDALPAVLRGLPADARVISLGGSAVFWWQMIPGYSTVWNENPVGKALASSGGDPEAAITALRQAGWTHLVVDETMLNVWSRAGWLDPAINPAAVSALTTRLKPLRLASGGSLYAIVR